MSGLLLGISFCAVRGDPMQLVDEAELLAEIGLKGDRYSLGEGSFNLGSPGERQVTLINARFLKDGGLTFPETRRNLLVSGVELMWHIDREFQVGRARLRGLKYCDPCERPSNLARKHGQSFREQFLDCGGLIAEVTVSGPIKFGDPVIPARRNSALRSIEEEYISNRR